MVKVFIACSGLGCVKRGFETFTQECFDALVNEPSIEFTLFKGSGKSLEKEIALGNLSRSAWQAELLGKLTGRSAYNIEQSTFAYSLLPYIHREDPDVIYFSDINFGHALWYWRRLTKKKYKLLFSNGTPLAPPFPRWDHIQQLTPVNYHLALSAGVSSEKQSLVPLGFHLPPQLQLLSSLERKALRSKLELPEDKAIVLSVGWIDKSHKRMDYLIREVASLNRPELYLLLLGHQDSASSEVTALGMQLLGAHNFQVRTVEPKEVPDYYKIVDIFALASLQEGFGRVYVEAMSHGLPCLAHDNEVTRFILGERGYLDNFEVEGNLANLILEVLSEGYNKYKCSLRHQSVYNRFSWKQLHSKYIEMIQRCAKLYVDE
jgi:1,2-diacylglycerol 3-alpha-glucosyltransferase